MLIYSLPVFLLISFGLSAQMGGAHDPNRITVPLGGNSWTNYGAAITKEGLTGWSDAQTVCKTYLRVNQAGSLKVSLLMNPLRGTSTIKVSLGEKSVNVAVEGDVEKEFYAGEWKIDKQGYVVIELQGVQKSGSAFGNVSHLGVSGTAISSEAAFVKNNEGNYFYWGRRGPSVHLKYNAEGIEDIEWFYSEITVPPGNDVIGSYFMANGFKEGYFGFQVNSAIERRILFSVWSPFQTDDPRSIPEDQKIKLMKKGKDTYTGEFGNEGSGGQSYQKYNWTAGSTYQFLLQGKPTDDNATIFTAWFYAPEEKQWRLIASFSRPKTSTYLTNLHSFLENFMTETGDKTRMALYGNQWARTAEGKWTAVTKAQFTGDNTARKGYRMDYAGGVDHQTFFLKNCGFFDAFSELNQVFVRPQTGEPPTIDLSKLYQ